MKVYADDPATNVDDMCARFEGIDGVTVGGPNGAGMAIDQEARWAVPITMMEGRDSEGGAWYGRHGKGWRHGEAAAGSAANRALGAVAAIVTALVVATVALGLALVLMVNVPGLL